MVKKNMNSRLTKKREMQGGVKRARGSETKKEKGATLPPLIKERSKNGGSYQRAFGPPKKKKKKKGQRGFRSGGLRVLWGQTRI